MAVTLGTAQTTALTNGNVVSTIAFTSTTDPLYVVVAWWDATTQITSMTYGLAAMTRVAQSLASQSADRVEIWRLTAPASGANNLVITFPGTSNAGSAIIANAAGQDGTTPEGTAVSAKSTANGTATGNLSVAGNATGDLTLWGIANGNGAAITPAAVGGGTVTEIGDAAASGERSEAAKVPDAATAVSGSWTGSTSWAIAAIPLKTAGGAATTRGNPFGTRGNAFGGGRTFWGIIRSVARKLIGGPRHA